MYSGEEVQVQCPDSARDIDLLEDDTPLLVACNEANEANVQVLDVSVLCTVHEIQHEKEVYCKAVAPNGQIRAFAYGWRGGLQVQDASNNEMIIMEDESAKKSAFSGLFLSMWKYDCICWS